MHKITILTEPIKLMNLNYWIRYFCNKFYFSKKFNFLRPLREIIRNFQPGYIDRLEFGGHTAVTRSLIEGFNKIGFNDYIYRPKSINAVTQEVHVLAGVDTLKQAIDLKKRGVITKLTAGPNIVVFADENNSIIADTNIDLYLQPSQWATDLHIEIEPRLKGRCVAWPSGIDITKFNPNAKIKDEVSNVLIYHKAESDQFCHRIECILKKYGYNPIVLKYHKYEWDEYIEILNKCLFSICISRQESQGIFLTEIWAMDVPTLCYDPHYYVWDEPYHKEVIGNISTCPYLCEKTGLRWIEISELEKIIQNIPEIISQFEPRKWVMENMTDEICAKKFLKIMDIQST